MLKIAYAYPLDAGNPAVQSGRPASILRQFKALGGTVIPVFPMTTRMSRLSTAKKAFYRLTGRFYRGDREGAYLDEMASEFKLRTHGVRFDIAFSPGSEAVSHLDIPQPISFCADATFANMLDYYWDFSSLSEEYVRKGHLQEAAALKRASLAVYPSDWAAKSALDFYGADPAKVAVIPFGANLGSDNRRNDVHRWIEARNFDCIRLLFVGKAWNRKGGDLVVETAQHLLARGFKVRLDVVSAKVPHRLANMPWVVCHGFLDPSRPGTGAVLGDLFKGAHFVFIPSRAEAYGMAFAEASAFGVPAIGTETGGIRSVVRNGVNGFTLPLSAGAAEFADAIAGAVSNHDEYYALCRTSFDEFEQRLNWRTFCGRFMDLAQQRCEQFEHTTEDCA